MSEPIFPGEQWDRVDCGGAFADAEAWLELHGEGKRYRVVVVQSGKLLAEWNQGVEESELVGLASAAKSVFSCVLAIAVDEGRIESPDARVVDVYPEMMYVPDGTGPKPGRHAFEKDREITFRQLISNTSGYMKPGEEPGKVFHYQTYGMNILTHAIATAYGHYASANAADSPGLQPLVDEKLRDPIGASWGYYRANFDLHSEARIDIFGHYDGIRSTALDMARLGWLWCNGGRWGERQIVPEAWLREATRTAPSIRENCSRDEWRYGYGFWTNEHGLLWPSLPRDAFCAHGAGRQLIFVCPSLELVIAQSPGLYSEKEEDMGLVSRVVAALDV